MKEKPLTEFIGSNARPKKENSKSKGLKGPWELPEGWRWVRIKDIARDTERVDPTKTPEVEFWYVDIASIDNTQYKIINPKKIKGKDAPSRARKRIQEGDVIFATTRPYLKNVAIVPEWLNNQVCSTGFAVLRTIPEKTIPKWFFYYLISDFAIEQIKPMMRGANYPAITDRDLFNLKIPLPPLSEQKRIVAKLDEISRRLEEAKKLAREAREEAERLMASALHEVFSKAEERGWEWRKLNEICEKITDRDHKTPKYTPQGIPVISPENFTPFGIDFKSAKKYIPEEDYKKELRRVDPKPGDILYSRIGTIGEARLLKEFPPFIPLHSLVLIRPNTQVVTSEYLLYVLNSQIVRAQAKEKTRSIGTPDLGIREIRRFRIPLPPLEEQKRIVAYLDAVSERAQRLVKLYEEREKELGQLFPAILDRAFRGEV